MAFHLPKRSKSFRAISPLLIFLLLAPVDKCDQRLNEAIEASDNMLANTEEAYDIKEALHDFHRITDEENNRLTSLLDQASTAAKQFNNEGRALRAQKDSDTPENRKKLAELFSGTAKAMTDVRLLGVNPLNDSYAVRQFDPVFEKFNQNMETIAAAFGCKDLGNNCMKCPPDPPGVRICEP